MAKIYRVDFIMQITARDQTKDLTALTAAYDAFVSSEDFKASWPNYQGIPMLPGFGGRSAAFRKGTERWIRMGTNRSESTMLHEIAHHVNDLHPDRYGPRDSHGAGFAAAMLDVVSMYQGDRGRYALIAGYAQEKIKVWVDGSKVQLPMPWAIEAAIASALEDLSAAAESRKRISAGQRAHRAERTERLVASLEPGSWEDIDYRYSKVMRSVAAKRAWETRRARAASHAALPSA